MKRREVLLAGAGTLGALAWGQRATASGSPRHGLKTARPMPGKSAVELQVAVTQCVQAGHVCLEHCLRLLAQGDRSLGACASLVKQMVAVCSAVAPVVASGSKHAQSLVRVCADLCADCKKECDRHAHHHAECKACSEACERTVAAAKAFLA